MHATRIRPRRGFTLLELMVVMAIILTLAGLLLAAVFKALNMGKKLAQVSDIKNLHEAVTAFKTHFGLEYMPSKITLASSPSGMPPEDVNYMRRMFPSAGFMKIWESQGMQWGASGQLQGHECLVFFLGGPQQGGKPIGWARNAVNPCDPNGDRLTFFDFPQERLTSRGSPWLSFLDPDKNMPYAYFSKRTSMNTYDRQDCQRLGVFPYGNANEGFMNADSYQIIGPGTDGQYGTSGSFWTPQTAASVYPRRDPGADDVSNFHGSQVLGANSR